MHPRCRGRGAALPPSSHPTLPVTRPDSDRQRRAGIAYLAGLCATAGWTVLVAYLLPPWAGGSEVRLTGFLAGAAAAFWVGQRLARALMPQPPGR